jgi:DNA-binding transcriptional ArsR family regulator
VTTDDRATAVFRALAEPHRREILRLVAGAELPAGEIARAFDVSRPAISQHIAVLKDAGLITERRVGTKRYYRAEHRRLPEVRAYLDDLWGGALARAKNLAEGPIARAAAEEAG